MNNSDLLTIFQERDLRIEQSIHIALSVGDGEAVSSLLNDFLAIDEADLLNCFPDLPSCVTDAPSTDIGFEFAQWCIAENKLGFLVEIATPSMRYSQGGCSFSWSRYLKKWFYAEKYEDAIQICVNWVAAKRDEEMKRQHIPA